MKLAGSPDAHDEAICAHEPTAPELLHANSGMQDSDYREDGAAVGDATTHPRSRKCRSDEIAISYFHNDPAKSPSANLEVGDERYSLIFATADMAEDRLRASSSQEWRTWFEEQCGSIIRQQSQSATRAGSVSQYVMSPIYSGDDRFGRKSPFMENCVVVLAWEADEPVRAVLVLEYNWVYIDLERFSKGENKKPLYKGMAALPQPKEEQLAA